MPQPSGGTRKGKLVVISGPSGAGKSTVCRRLAEAAPEIQLSVSATTRPPRPGEKEGVDYYFISRDEFERRVKAGGFAEHAEYAGNLYGTPRKQLEDAVAHGKTIVMDIDVQGAAQVVREYPDAVTIFLAPPNFDALQKRLRGRNTDSSEAMARRIEIARNEMTHSRKYKHNVVNDDLQRAVDKILDIIVAGH